MCFNSSVWSSPRFILFAFIYLVICAPLHSQDKSQSLINGNLSTSFDIEAKRTYPSQGIEPGYGFSSYASVRFRSNVSEDLGFFISANIIGLGGFYAESAGSAVAVELERLYLKAGSEALDVEAGLIRIARGYGYVFSPIDVFNTRDAANTIDPQGRPRGKWGIHASFFPQDMWRIELFGLLPDKPLDPAFWGSKAGIATTFSSGKMSFDLLYSLYLPEIAYGSAPIPAYVNNDFTHIAGFALKADVEIGLSVEAVYMFEQRMFREVMYYGKPFKGYEGLSASLGIDYTVGDAYLLAEYMFYGPGHVDWGEESLDSLYSNNPLWIDTQPLARFGMIDLNKKPLPFARHDYLFLLFRYSAAQDLSAGASLLAGLDDLSALATIFCEYQIVSGLTLDLSAIIPFDKRQFDSSAPAGEWGSANLGFHFLARIGARMRF